MNEEHIIVEFTVSNGRQDEFLDSLQKAEEGDAFRCIGWRVGESASHRVPRAALQQFAAKMEEVLRKHDHKSTWRTRPIEALNKLMMLEIEEFSVALEFFEVSEARKELIDIANYAMILHDRLGMLDQDRSLNDQVGVSNGAKANGHRNGHGHVEATV